MKSLDLTVPTSWGELNQDQLEFLLKMIDLVNHRNFDRRFLSAEDYSVQTSAEVATFCLFRWNGLSIVTPYADAWLLSRGGHEYLVSDCDIAAATTALSWLNELPLVPVRLARIDGAEAVDASLDDGFSFDDWLSCETLWQGYQATKSDELLRRMAEILYRKPGISLRTYEILGVFYWWAGIKAECNRLYPNFLQPAPASSDTQPSQELLRRNMDAQIRALTKGDITKEEMVLAMPAHRALTELDALAREYDELNRKYPAK